MNFQKIKEQDKKNILNTYNRFDVCIESGKGAVCKDINGKKYIDFTSGIGVNSLGFCHPEWVKAVSEQAGKLAHISNLYYTLPDNELAKTLCEQTGYGAVFFGNSGAEANEGAIKTARKYSFDKYGEGRSKIITLKNSFHGRTVTTLKATGQDKFHQYFFPFTEGFDYAEAGDLEDLKKKAGKDVCAVMIELIQGEGGVCPLEKEFVLELYDFCRENNLLLMIDEVQTGMGRTGRLFCYENYGIQPDVVTSAKGLGGGLPIGACLCSAELSGVLDSGTHGTTYGGNPIACAGAAYVLEKVKDPAFLQQVAQKGAYIKNALLQMEQIAQVRGMGMMLGLALKKGSARQTAEKCVKNGLLVLTAKELLRLLPPLTITYEEIDRGLSILKACI